MGAPRIPGDWSIVGAAMPPADMDSHLSAELILRLAQVTSRQGPNFSRAPRARCWRRKSASECLRGATASAYKAAPFAIGDVGV